MAVRKPTPRTVRALREAQDTERRVRSAIDAVRKVEREVLSIDHHWLVEEDPHGGSMRSRALSLPGHSAAIIVYGETEEIAEARMQRLLRGWELAGKEER